MAGGVFAAFVLVEVGARILGAAPTVPPDSYYNLSAVTGTIPLPYDRFVYNEDGREVLATFNYRSLRDIDHDYEKPPGTQRIMFLGDSYTAGWQIELGENYVSRMRTWLNALPNRPVDYDLINAGWHGWGTDRQYLFYREEGYRYDNDLVVLQIYVGNDFSDNGIGLLGLPIPGDRPYFSLDESGDLRYVPYTDSSPHLLREGRSFGEQVKAFLRERFFTYNVIRKGAWSLGSALRGAGSPTPTATTSASDATGPHPLPVVHEIFGPSYDERWEAVFEITRQLLHELRLEVEASGGRLVAFIVPVEYALSSEKWAYFVEYHELTGEWDPNRPAILFETMLEDEAIPYLNLTPALRDYIEETGHWLRYGVPHWTPEGHCVAGVIVQNWLLTGGFVDSPPAYVPVDPVSVCAD